MRPFTLACALLCFWAASSSVAAPKPPRYDITDLGALHTSEPGVGFYPARQGAFAINNCGQILLSTEGDYYSSHPFLWECGRLTDLSHLGPIGKSQAAALNDLGQVLINAGTGETYTEMQGKTQRPVTRASIYFRGEMTLLRLPLHAVVSSGEHLNNRGEAVGSYRTANNTGMGGTDGGGPVFWSAWGTPFKMNGIGPFSNHSVFSSADFIGSSGKIFGEMDGSLRYYVRTGKVLTALQFSAGRPYSNIDSFNDKGQMVGQWALPEPRDRQGFETVFHAFLTESDEAKYPAASIGIFQPGARPLRIIELKITDLGVLPGDVESKASALNNKGQIVGWSRNFTAKHYVAFQPRGATTLAAFQAQKVAPQKQVKSKARAFLWQNGQMYDLHSLTRHGADWELHNATGINERGQIIGNGLWKVQLHAFLLTPH